MLVSDRCTSVNVGQLAVVRMKPGTRTPKSAISSAQAYSLYHATLVQCVTSHCHQMICTFIHSVLSAAYDHSTWSSTLPN
jgi:hypothetical protein